MGKLRTYSNPDPDGGSSDKKKNSDFEKQNLFQEKF
jgi:hypothetical protein